MPSFKSLVIVSSTTGVPGGSASPGVKSVARNRTLPSFPEGGGCSIELPGRSQPINSMASAALSLMADANHSPSHANSAVSAMNRSIKRAKAKSRMFLVYHDPWVQNCLYLKSGDEDSDTLRCILNLMRGCIIYHTVKPPFAVLLGGGKIAPNFRGAR